MSNIIVNFPLCEMTMSDIKPTTITDSTNSKGSSGQNITSTGTAVTWTSPYISSAGVSTGNLNMNNFAITSPNVLEMNGGSGMLLNSIGDTCEILGISNVGGITLNANTIAGCTTIDGNSSALTIGQGVTTTSTVIGKSTATTNIQGRVQFSGSAGTSGQVLQSNGTGTVPTWTTPYISSAGASSGNLNMNNFAITSPSVLEMNGVSGMSLNSIGVTCEILGISNVGGMTLNANTIAGCSSVDGNSGALAIGQGVSTTSTAIGKATATTNIQGNVQFSSSAGTSGQYLRSNGAGTVPTWVNGTGAWSGTALTNLDMGGFDITGADSIDNNAGAMVIGANTTGMTIGKASTTTTVNGTLSTATIEPSSSSSTLDIGNTQVTGNLIIGSGASRSAQIGIMTGANSSGTINMLSGTTSTGIINMGGSSVTVRTNRPLTLNYNPSSIATNQLGSVITPTFTGSNPRNNTAVNLAYADLTTGVWMINSNCTFLQPGVTGVLGLSISSSNATFQNASSTYMTTPANNTTGINTTRIVKLTVDARWYLVGLCSSGSCTVQDVVFDVYRIA